MSFEIYVSYLVASYKINNKWLDIMSDQLTGRSMLSNSMHGMFSFLNYKLLKYQPSNIN